VDFCTKIREVGERRKPLNEIKYVAELEKVYELNQRKGKRIWQKRILFYF
jgi:hypothetical protein